MMITNLCIRLWLALVPRSLLWLKLHTLFIVSAFYIRLAQLERASLMPTSLRGYSNAEQV